MPDRQARTRRGPPHPPPTSLLGTRWLLPNVGIVVLRKPAKLDVDFADAAWPAHRPATQVAGDWRWEPIFREMHEQFALVADDRPLAFWASAKHRPLRISGGPAYRLDRLELDPRRRGQGVGPIALGAVTLRAFELGCTMVVFAALPAPGLLGFYRELGATEETVPGWTAPRGLVPFVLRRSAMIVLQEAIDELRAEEPEGPEVR